MKAYSLYQPWASLMAIDAKRNETRPRPLAYNGDIVICATKLCWRERVPTYAIPALTILWAFRDKFPGYHANVMDLYLSLPFGKAVCVVQKTGCVRTQGNEQTFLTAQEFTLGDYSPGRFAYPTTNPRRLKTPVPVRGRQSLFDLSPEEAAAVKVQLPPQECEHTLHTDAVLGGEYCTKCLTNFKR